MNAIPETAAFTVCYFKGWLGCSTEVRLESIKRSVVTKKANALGVDEIDQVGGPLL